VKFLAGRESSKGKAVENVTIDIYGRGNNAYRWSAKPMSATFRWKRSPKETTSTWRRPSLSAAFRWAVPALAPRPAASVRVHGHGSRCRLHRHPRLRQGPPDKLPDYIERCLHIYDAADYAENLANIPCVAYSGEKDPQMAAVTNVEARLKAVRRQAALHALHRPGPGAQAARRNGSRRSTNG